jgi:serine O-acetyltransferase
MSMRAHTPELKREDAELMRPMKSAASISASEPDWSRERRERTWEPSKALLKSWRDYQRAHERGFPLRMKIAVLRHRFWSVITGADIPINCKIAGGLRIPHPNGIVIHPDAEIGPNCLLFQQVTIGDSQGAVPLLGGHVDVGAGAKLIGKITIGDHAKIGANAVVMKDVPSGATAVGIPARIVRG